MIREKLAAIFAVLGFASFAASTAQAADLTASQRYAIERACERTFIVYTHATDTNNAAGIYGSYAKNGVLKNNRGEVKGIAAISDYFNKRVPERVQSGITTRHVLTNITVTPIDATHAKGVAYETLYRYDTRKPITSLSPVLVAVINAEFVLENGACRFVNRDVAEVTAGQ